MPKILFISHSSTWGGAEKCLYLILKALPRDEFQALVMLPDNGPLRDAITDLGIDTCIGPVLPWLRPAVQTWRGPDRQESVDRIAWTIESEGIDVVFTNTSVVVGGALAARQCGIPHIWHVLEILSLDSTLTPTFELRQFYLIMNLLSDRIIAASDSVRAEIEQFDRFDAVEVIHTVIDQHGEAPALKDKSEVFGVSSDTIVVTFVGALSRRKGAEDLVACAPMVLKRNPDAKFMIVGPDAERASFIREQITALQLENSVRVLGFRDDVDAVLTASDVFVLPTRSDPLPLVVQEAMYAGTPVVATHSGGCSDMVIDGLTGLLVPVRSPEALCDALTTLIEDSELRTQMAIRAREHLNTKFSPQDFCLRMSDLFRCMSASSPDSGINIESDDLVEILAQSIDACGMRFNIEDQYNELLVEHDSLRNAFSTRIGWAIAAPWRWLRLMLGF